MLKTIFIAAFMFIAVSCSDKRQGDEKAIDIVEQCIEQHGGKNYRDMMFLLTFGNLGFI
jgi:hypothetical protein